MPACAFLADLTVIVHATFVLFVVAGGLLAIRWPNVIWLHLPAVFWGAAVEWLDWVCPLTPLEKWFRAQGGGTRYDGQFVERCLVQILYPAGLTRRMQVGLAVFVLVANALVYWTVFRSRRRGGPLAARPKIR